MAADKTIIIPTTPIDPEVADSGDFSKVGPVAAGTIEGKDMQANLSIVASINAETLNATGSAIGIATVSGEATITASAVPALITRGDTTMQQSYASAVIVGGGATTKIHQSASPAIIGKSLELTQSVGAVLVAGDADVKHSWVGIVVAPKATVSEDSHVLLSTKGALIIAAALFGGFGLVALALALGMRRVARWRPHLSMPSLASLQSMQAMRSRQSHRAANRSMPNIPSIQAIEDALKNLPDLSAIQERWIHRKA